MNIVLLNLIVALTTPPFVGLLAALAARARWEGTLPPSKLQASFAVGKPVIFVGDPTQDSARWIADADAGWVVAENDTGALLTAIAAARDRTELARRGRNASAYAQKHFDAAQDLRARRDCQWTHRPVASEQPRQRTRASRSTLDLQTRRSLNVSVASRSSSA